jgi:hypothetical protein
MLWQNLTNIQFTPYFIFQLSCSTLCFSPHKTVRGSTRFGVYRRYHQGSSIQLHFLHNASNICEHLLAKTAKKP